MWGCAMRVSMHCFSERARRAWQRHAALAMLVLLGLFAPLSHAHKASDAYLLLTRDGDSLALRWDIALRDLDAALDLDADGDRQLRWGEITARLGDIRAYALPRLRLQGGRCALAEAQPPAIDRRIDGAYLVLQLAGRCTAAPALEIEYRLFADIDPTHRGLLRVDQGEGAAPLLRSLAPGAGAVSLDLPAGGAAAESSAGSFFRDGVHHILIGYDHVLFLVCLLLPAVLRRAPEGWRPVERARDAIWPMVGIVTMFTLAHSITLAAAGLRLVTVPPSVVEPAIALTIVIAALDSLYPLLRGRHKLFAFIFGLIHGFGFAGVLSELALPAGGLVQALLAFNVGVEAGQLVIVGCVLALLLALRWWQRYPAVVLKGGSVAAISIAGIWFVERVFDARLMPF
jgi:hypothetical protein